MSTIPLNERIIVALDVDHPDKQKNLDSLRYQDLQSKDAYLENIHKGNLPKLQAILHMAVGLALAPATGLALPLVSYGRSNLIMTLVAMGMLISVARATPGGKAARA